MKAPAQYSSQLVIHSSYYPNAFLNNHVLSPVLKTLNDIHSFREFGRLFQSVGPETAKLRGPEQTDEHLGMSLLSLVLLLLSSWYRAIMSTVQKFVQKNRRRGPYQTGGCILSGIRPHGASRRGRLEPR